VVELFRQGSQWLEQMRTAHCSSQVAYRRKAAIASPYDPYFE